MHRTPSRPAEGNGNDNTHSGGFLSKLRGQAEAALAKLPSSAGELESNLRHGIVAANPRQSPHTLKTQLAIKTYKGVLLDHEGIARENKALSKTILDLTKEDNHATGTINDDIVDVGDRLAFLLYRTGDLHQQYAKEAEQARVYLKDIRNAETPLNAQRDRRLQLTRDIARLRTNAKPDTSTTSRINALQLELDEFTRQGSPLANAEAAALTARRAKLSTAFKVHFQALQELGEKLAILAVYGQALADGIDTSSQAGKTDYTGNERTAAIRNGVEHNLNAWSLSKANTPKPSLPGTTNISSAVSATSYAPSFSETHRAELAALSTGDTAHAQTAALDSYYPTTSSSPGLGGEQHNKASSIHSTDSHAAVAHASVGSSYPQHAGNNAPLPPPRHPSLTHSSSGGGGASSPPVPSTVPHSSPLVQQLNQMPVSAISPTPVKQDPHASPSIPGVAPQTPTIAETGKPITGTGGPSSGVLSPPTTSTGTTGASATMSKEEEARIETQRRFDALRTGQANGGADLEREVSLSGRRGGEQLPPYQSQGGSSGQ
ncbi:lipid-binding protein [Cystobasidiomycetes sp. EMM_F5]